MTTISKYQRGKIYKIITENSNDVYIGSTIQTLKARLTRHKSECKAGGNCSSTIVLRQGNYTIELITDYPCNSKAELVREEGKYQREMDCVNKMIAGRTPKEYYEEHRDELLLKMKIISKKHYLENKQDIDAKHKENWEKNKEVYKKKHKEYYKKNREELRKKAGVKHNCPCGAIVRHDKKSTHLKSKKHKKYLLTLNNAL